MDVYVTWGHGKPIKCHVHEIEPKGDHLLSQLQYRPNLITNKLDIVQVSSPPLGMITVLDGLHKLIEKNH